MLRASRINGDGRRLPGTRSPFPYLAAAQSKAPARPSSWRPPRNSPLRDVDPQFQELTVHPRRAPEHIEIRDLRNQLPDSMVLRWPTGPALLRQAGPVQRESLSMPAGDSFGLQDDKRLLPVGPASRQKQPEDSVRSPESRAPVTPIQNGELLPQGEIFESQFRPQLQRSKNQGEQSQNRQHHGRRVSDSTVHQVNCINQAGVLATDMREREVTVALVPFPLPWYSFAGQVR